MSRSKGMAMAMALGAIGLVAPSEAARVDTGWVTFDLRMDKGNTYVYPKLSNGTSSYIFAGNCQFNALILTDTGDRFSLYGMLLTAKEQGLRVNLAYDDTDGPVCRLAQLHIEWAD